MAVEERLSFGERLRQLRTSAGLTQEQLAEAAGLTVNAISALERGERQRPYPHTIEALATALDLVPEQRAALIASVPRRVGSAADPPIVEHVDTHPAPTQVAEQHLVQRLPTRGTHVERLRDRRDHQCRVPQRR